MCLYASVCARTNTRTYTRLLMLQRIILFFFFFTSPRPPWQDFIVRFCLGGRKINKNALIGRQTRFPLGKAEPPSRRAAGTLIRGGCGSHEFMHMAEDVTDHWAQRLERLGCSERRDSF